MADEPNSSMPTESQMEAGAEVLDAGAAAAAAEPDPGGKRGAAAAGIRKEASKKGWELTEAQADMLAGLVVSKMADLMAELPDQVVDKIGERGGYDKLPEPLSHPAAPTGAGTLPAAPALEGAAPADERPALSTGASSFARRFRTG